MPRTVVGQRPCRAGRSMWRDCVQSAMTQRLGAVSGLMPHPGADTSKTLVIFLGLSGASPPYGVVKPTQRVLAIFHVL